MERTEGNTSKRNDDDDIFAQYIATELRSTENPQLKWFTKWRTQSLIFGAHSGYAMHRHGNPTPGNIKGKEDYCQTSSLTISHSCNSAPHQVIFCHQDTTPSSFSAPSPPFPEQEHIWLASLYVLCTIKWSFRTLLIAVLVSEMIIPIVCAGTLYKYWDLWKFHLNWNKEIHA